MVEDVISYYPGAGGNRYLRYITNNEWQHKEVYDECNVQEFNNRYFDGPANHQDKNKIVLTHNVNTIEIRERFPNAKITYIDYNLKDCLRREWILLGRLRYRQRVDYIIDKLEHYNAIRDESWDVITDNDALLTLPSYIKDELEISYNKMIKQVPVQMEFDSCTEEIQYHLNYYKNHPKDMLYVDTVVNLNDMDNEFSVIMKKNIDKYQSVMFDERWKVLNEYMSQEGW